MKELINRFLAESPTFFKRLIKIGLTLGAIGGALMEPHIAEVLPDVSKFASHLVAIGLVTAAVAKFTVKNPEDINGPKP